MAKRKSKKKITDWKPGKKEITSKLYAKYGRKLRINRNDWKLVFASDILASTGERVLGLCIFDDKTIVCDCEDPEVESTLLHEIGHAELAEASFYQNPSWSSELEEMVVDTISQGIAKNFSIRKK